MIKIFCSNGNGHETGGSLGVAMGLSRSWREEVGFVNWLPSKYRILDCLALITMSTPQFFFRSFLHAFNIWDI